MSNETEREAFEIAYTCAIENGWGSPKELARYIWDQAGAAYQRERDKKPAVKEWKCRHSAGEKWFISDHPGYWECVPIQEAQPADALVEALEDAIHSMLDCGYSKSSAVVIRKGTDALAAYRAAQEKK